MKESEKKSDEMFNILENITRQYQPLLDEGGNFMRKMKSAESILSQIIGGNTDNTQIFDAIKFLFNTEITDDFSSVNMAQHVEKLRSIASDMKHQEAQLIDDIKKENHSTKDMPVENQEDQTDK